MSLLSSTLPEVRIERDGATIYADADGVQVAMEPGEDAAVVTLLVPVALLRALKHLLSHPQLTDLLGEPDARPPVA